MHCAYNMNESVRTVYIGYKAKALLFMNTVWSIENTVLIKVHRFVSGLVVLLIWDLHRQRSNSCSQRRVSLCMCAVHVFVFYVCNCYKTIHP